MLVYFYKPGCPHCQNFKPIWSKFKTKYGKIIDMREINGETSPEIINKFDLRGFPAVYVLNGELRHEYDPEKRTMATLEKFVRDKYNPHLKDKLKDYYQ